MKSDNPVLSEQTKLSSEYLSLLRDFKRIDGLETKYRRS
jgi:hypothetical protein